MQKKIIIGVVLVAGLATAASYSYFSKKKCSGTCCSLKASAPITGAETGLCAHCGKNSCDETCTIGTLSMPSCNLSPDALQKRGAETVQTIFKQVKNLRELEHGFEFDFVHTPELSRELEEFIAFERRCCATLSWTLNTDVDGKTMRLVVSGASDQKEEIRQGLTAMGWMQ
jgi:hypothetical protein